MDKKNIEAIYPLAPLQQAFLWHSLQTSAQDGLLHMRCTLRGQIETALFYQAWQSVFALHPALRTSVHWEGVKQPLQVVARQVEIPWQVLDWRTKEAFHGMAETALADFLREDRDLSFDLTTAPIARLALIRLTEITYELVWTCHHLMLDGWSGALVLNQVVDAYEALRRGEQPNGSTGPSFQAYIRWQQQQDAEAMKTFWQSTLAGFSEPTPLPFLQDIQGSCFNGSVSTASVVFTSEETAAVNGFLRSHRLTLNTLMQGVWSLLLHGYSQNADVLFGSTVSGRQGDMPGVESVVGLLINVLPVRVTVSSVEGVLDWLTALQRQQMGSAAHSHAALTDIQQWCEVSGRLFESLLVIENYPIREDSAAEGSLQIESVQSGVVSTYGLTILVKPGEVLTIAAESANATTDALVALLGQFHSLLKAVVEKKQTTVNDVLASGNFSFEDSVGDASEVPRSGSSLSQSTNLAGSTGAGEPDRLDQLLAMPQSSLELALLKIWSAVLGAHQSRSLTVEDSFFDWGGSSLLAVQIFNEMQQQLSCTLPLATLFQAPTVRKFSILLAQARADEVMPPEGTPSEETPPAKWSSLVPIQPNGTQRPFFFHGGSADALTWASFSQLLGADQPFYALQRPDLDGRDVTMLTVEDQAAICVKELRMVQPKGPYIVGGHCFGGAVAFEMAQQLQAQGQRVESVVLIDAYRPEVMPLSLRIQLQTQLNLSLFWLRKNYYYHGNRTVLKQLPRKVLNKLRGLSLTGESLSGDTPFENALSREVQAAEARPILDSSLNPSSPDSVSTLPYEVRYARAIAANDEAAALYQPIPYPGHIKLFRADIQMLAWYFGTALGWQTLATEDVSVTRIPGFFGNLLNYRAAPILAEQLKAYLATLPASNPVSAAAPKPMPEPASTPASK